MIRQELRPEKIVAVIVVHAKREQRLAPAPLGFGQHDRIRIDARVEERLQVLESLLLRRRPFRSLFRRRQRAAHRADFRRVVHDLRIDADQHVSTRLPSYATSSISRFTSSTFTGTGPLLPAFVDRHESPSKL